MKSKHLLLMLLLALVVPWAANAQTPLFSEDFEGGSMPTGWTTDGPGTWSVSTGDYSSSTGAGQGSYNAKITHGNTGDVTKLITPAIDLSSVASAELSFMHVQRSWAGDIDELKVYYRTSSTGTWTLLVEYTSAYASWTTEESITLPNPSSTYQIAFEHIDNYGYGVGIDQVIISTPPAFPKPTGLTVSNVTHNSATLSWTENGTATAWQIGYTANGGTEQYVSVTDNPYTLTGLTPLTTYEVRVQADYQDNTYSEFSNSISFSTTAVAEAVGDAWSDDFEGTSCDWQLINGTLTNAWAWGTATSNGGTHALYVSNDGGTTNAYTVNSAAMVYATKLLNFTEGKFEFAYNWMANGESNYDYLRVALVPASVTLTASTSYPTGFGTTTLPTGWIALDGGGKLNLVTDWQSQSVAVNVPAGNYYLVMAWRDDTSGGTNPPAAIDNVSITRITCGYDVEGLAVNNITTTTAAIAWTAGEPGQWQVAIKEGADEWDIFPTIANTNTYTITGLNPSTNYQVKVRAYCGGSDYGSWCNPISFATACDVIDAVGYSENFDSYTAGGGVLPICWSYINTTTYSYYQGFPRIYNYSSNSNPNCLYFYSYAYYSNGTTTYDPQPQYAILPEMTGLADKQVTLMAQGYSSTSTFKIGTMSDPTDAATFVAITEQALTTSYQEFEYVIPASASGNYLAIMIDAANESRTTNCVYIDDISITEVPACAKPTNLAVVNNSVTGHSATISWTSDGNAWQIGYTATGGTEQYVEVTENPYTLTGLAPETAYQVRVQTNCGGGTYSVFTNPVSFTTDVACPAPTGLAAALTPGNGSVATLSWTSDASAWVVAYKTADATDFTEVNVTENPYTLTSLTPETTYNAKVKAVCGGEDGESSWSNTITFTPTDAYTLTVNDGTTTNGLVPIYGYWCDNTTKSQFIIPASGLADMAWGTINKMTFYASNASVSWGDAQFEVYMTETNETTLSELADYSTMTKVKNAGSLSISGNVMVVELDAPYQYMGGNLMIGFLQTVTGTWGSCSWYGVSATGASMGGYGSSISQQNFLPKTTFGYTPGEEPSCYKPTGLAVSNVTNHTADLSWTSDATAWQIQVNEGTPIDVTTNPYTLTGLGAETEFSVKVRANCGSDGYSDWTAAITFTTEVACPAPTNVAISNVEPFAATVSWNGIAENYNLRYRTARGFHYNFESAEPWAVDDFAPCTTYDGDESSTYGISDYDMPNANYVGSVIAFSDNSQWAAHSGNTMGAFMDATIPTNDDYFITPELTIAAGDHFTFWARSVTSSYGLERIKVGVYGGNGTITSYLAGSADEYVEVPVAWTEFDYDLTAYAGQTIQLAINCVSDDAFALLIDDLFVGDPTDDTWDQTLTNVTSPYTLTGLTDETMYEVQVQAACGGEDGVSVWVDGGTFTTPSNCGAPTNLAANDVTISSATLSWEGFHNSYNLQYRTAATRETYYFNDFNTDQTGWTYPEVIYGFADPIYNVASSDNYFLAMGWSSTTEDTIVSCELPAYESGSYVEFYYFGYQTANTFQVGYSTTTNDAEAFTWGEPIDAPLSTYTRYQETLAAGVKYVAFKATASSQNACVFIDDFGIFGSDISEGAWQTRNAVTSPYSLTGLANDTKYEWQVQGINTACAGGVTEWSNMANFTTLNACMVPVIDSVPNVEATTATVYWTGAQESYNVRYGAYENMTNINFNDGVIPASMTNDETYPWTIVDGYIQSSNAGVSSSTSSISITLTLASKGVISFDAMFRGEGTSYDKCIFSIDDTQIFAYGAVDAEWHNIAYTVAAGTHTFTWTYSKDSSVNPVGDFFAIDNIKIRLSNNTWTTVEGVAGNSYDMTGLAPESIIAVQVQGVNDVCDGGVTEWSNEYLFITPEQTTFTQTIDMVEGKNWVSFSVEVTLDELKAALVAALPGTQITIQGKANSTTYNGTRWRGQLSTLDLSQMYKVTMTAACQVTLEGMPIDPAEHPVTINGKTGDKPTATWIAFPFGQDMTVADAFAGFAASGDQVKAKDAQTTYNGTRWRGTLTTLESGKGYVYLSNSTENRVFTFPSTSKAAPAKAQVPTGKAVTRPMRASKLAIPTKK